MLDVKYIDLNRNEITTEKIPYRISYNYLPSQMIKEGDKLNEVKFDDCEYSKDRYNDAYSISEQGEFLGSNGITFTINPLLYNPKEQLIIPISSAKFVISVNADISLTEMMDEYLYENKYSAAQEVISFYDNYKDASNKSTSNLSTISGMYLIVTTYKYLGYLATFINHKRSLGYDVRTAAFADGTSPTTIRNCIKSYLTSSGEYPKYTLLIGNYSDIPYSMGTIGDDDDPPTDIYYACLEKTNIGSETNFRPETMVGRWPVKNSTELNAIINKTISFENKSNVVRRFALYSGTGAGEDDFASDMNTAYTKLSTTPNSSLIKFDGRSGFDHTHISFEFSNYDDLIFYYRGHGNYYQLGSPYSAITAYNLPTSQSYFAIDFAYQLNWPEDNKFGNRWINNGDLSCGMYAATTDSYRSSNEYLSRYIFNYYKDQATNLTWGQWLSFGAAKYYSGNSNFNRRRQTKKYLILGDPSLYIFGIDHTTLTPKPYNVKAYNYTAIDENIEDIIDGEEIEHIAIYDITGKCVCNTKIDGGIYNSMLKSKIKELPKGVYTIVCQTKDKPIITKIYK
ncbi:MAG: hypothetical protein IJ756_10145 [Paludibacteraceae bacterium]|nr:hypothetical protein [Paludibacteraceae bacterium]